MMKFFVKGQQGITCVSNIFIDEYMRDANGEFVKIYLYLLRAEGSGAQISISDIADHLDHTQRDIARALKYWEGQGLLELEFDESGELDGLCLISPESASQQEAQPEPADSVGPILIPPASAPVAKAVAAPAPAAVSAPVQRAAAPVEAPREPNPYNSPGDEEVRELLFISESYMGRPLTELEINTILFWYVQMHMSSDLIDYLVGYCVDRGHKSIHYMNRVALNWADEGITSVAQAKQESSDHSKHISTVKHSFGISGRSLTKFEIAFVDRWSSSYGFTPQLIEEACRRTILTAHAPDFKYADSILKDWYLAGVTTMEDVEAQDAKHAESVKSRLSVISGDKKSKSSQSNNKFHNFKNRDYDFAALENTLLGEN